MTLDDVVIALDQISTILVSVAIISSFFKGFAVGNSF